MKFHKKSELARESESVRHFLFSEIISKCERREVRMKLLN